MSSDNSNHRASLLHRYNCLTAEQKVRGAKAYAEYRAAIESERRMATCSRVCCIACYACTAPFIGSAALGNIAAAGGCPSWVALAEAGGAATAAVACTRFAATGTMLRFVHAREALLQYLNSVAPETQGMDRYGSVAAPVGASPERSSTSTSGRAVTTAYELLGDERRTNLPGGDVELTTINPMG